MYRSKAELDDGDFTDGYEAGFGRLARTSLTTLALQSRIRDRLDSQSAAISCPTCSSRSPRVRETALASNDDPNAYFMRAFKG